VNFDTVRCKAERLAVPALWKLFKSDRALNWDYGTNI